MSKCTEKYILKNQLKIIQPVKIILTQQKTYNLVSIGVELLVGILFNTLIYTNRLYKKYYLYLKQVTWDHSGHKNSLTLGYKHID